MDLATLIVVGLVIVTALVFDFTNGFHDTAHAMATSIPEARIVDQGVVVGHA